MDNGYSLGDLSAIANANGLGGNSAWILILFFLIFGGNGWNRNGDYGQFATAASQQDILFGQKFSDLNTAINKVGDGLSSLGYSQLQQMDGNTASINGNIVNEGRALQAQLAECCCSNKEAIAQVRYDMANFNAATQASIHAEGEATRGLIQQNKIEALQARVNQLEMASAVGNVPRINPYMYGIVPTCGCNCNQ